MSIHDSTTIAFADSISRSQNNAGLRISDGCKICCDFL